MIKALVILNSQRGNHDGLTPFYVTVYRKVSIKSQFTASISDVELFLESHEFAPTTKPQIFNIGVEAGCSHYLPTWNDDSVHTPVRSINTTMKYIINLPGNQDKSHKNYISPRGAPYSSYNPLEFIDFS